MKQKPYDAGYLTGMLLIIIGALLLFTSLTISDLVRLLTSWWPLLLILYGVHLYYSGRTRAPKRPVSQTSSPSTPGVHQNLHFQDLDLSFEQTPAPIGRFHVLCGQIRVNADRLCLPGGEHSVHLSAMPGSIRIRTLREIPVKVDASAICGQITIYGKTVKGLHRHCVYESAGFATADTRLYIFCDVAFGKIKVL